MKLTALGAIALMACKGSAVPVVEDAGDGSITEDANDAALEPPPENWNWAFQSLGMENGPLEITDLAFVPATNRFFVTAKSGLLVEYELDDPETGPARQVASVSIPGVHADSDCGLISIRIAPDFESTSHIYLGLCTSQYRSGVFRIDYDQDPTDLVEIIALEEPDATHPWHNVGAMMFDDTGAMLVLFGDKTIRNNGQDATEPLGSMLRIRPEPDGGYTVPEDNPFAGDDDPRDDRVWAYGLRSPWRGYYAGDRIWIGDVGASSIEEINVVTEPGQNFGWADHEGPCDEDCEGLIDPVLYWSRSESHPYILDDPDATISTGRVAFVALEYPDEDDDDPYLGLLDGRVLFGDMALGFVRAARIDDAHELRSDLPVGHAGAATGWSLGPDDYVFAATFAGVGDLLRLVHVE